MANEKRLKGNFQILPKLDPSLSQSKQHSVLASNAGLANGNDTSRDFLVDSRIVHTSVLPTKKNSVKPQAPTVDNSSTGSTVLYNKTNNKFFLKSKKAKTKKELNNSR